jgi:hypothetical protein
LPAKRKTRVANIEALFRFKLTEQSREVRKQVTQIASVNLRTKILEIPRSQSKAICGLNYRKYLLILFFIQIIHVHDENCGKRINKNSWD